MKRRLVLGIDPGLSGAAALVTAESNALLDVIDMPLRDHFGRSVIDEGAFSRWVGAYADEIEAAVIEDVGVMTGREGVVGMFRFGQAAGVAAGVAAGHTIPLYYVKPSVWKMLAGLSRDKDASRKLASERFGGAHFKRKKDDGRAEAALLAAFGADRFLRDGNALSIPFSGRGR